MVKTSSVFALASALIIGVDSQFINLPDVPQGVFNVSTRIEIQGTAAAAWDAITDFANYPTWNPFVRKAVVVSPLHITLPEQRPVEGAHLYFRVQIPPLPLPVDENTPDNPLNTQFSYENITHVQPELGRVAWKYYAPEVALEAERWSAVTDIAGGKVVYESREVYSGLLASTLRASLAESLQQSFDAQGEGLKLLLEES
ncbi:hypothetical protein DM02DRAFT_652624 [Periconia macrospinosa]|uniref:Coenzyme Q-binding protein COQ10 START domain-containing protein n=1 Tax=Periconia macrospinosa TaxID=97972 RepID=A0A2V1DZA6_9PLEO|nr:hypothetical protein DM02DRAFT_652624 [Periconia macrospinosa]